MNKLIKSVCVFVSILLVFSLFIGCTASKGTLDNVKEDTAKDDNKVVKSKTPDIIRIPVQQITERAEDRTTYVDELLEERLNIKFSKTTIPGDSWQEKQTVMMAAGSLDMVDLLASTYYEHAKKEYLMDLSNIIPEKLTNFNAILSDDLKKALTVNGKIYGVNTIPKKATVEDGATNMTHARISIRRDWLEKLDLNVPKTIDDVYEVAKAFYYADPDGVGKDNLAIITACNGFSYLNLDWIFGAFGVMNNIWHVDDNEKVVSYDVDPRMKEAIEWLRIAYNENLLDKDFMTQKEPQMKDKIQNDKVGFWGGHWGALFADPWPLEHQELKMRASGELKADEEYKPDKSEPFKLWQPIEPPKGPRGDWGTRTSPAINMYPKAIPKNAKNVDAVLRYWDFISTEEGGMLCAYGVQGVDYILTDDGPQPGPAVGEQEYSEYRFDKGFRVDQIWHPSIKYSWGTDLAQRTASYGSYGGEIIVKKGIEWACPQYVNAIAQYALTGGKTAGQLRAKLNSMSDEYWSKMVVGEYDMSKWDEYVERWYKEGGQQLIEEYTAEYKSLK